MSLVALLPAAANSVTTAIARATKSVGDGISFTASLALPTAAAPPTPAAPLVVKLPPDLQAALDRFSSALRVKLAAAGIDTSPAVELSHDVLGGVAVGGNRPDQSVIEQLIQDDPQLQQSFHDLAAQIQKLASAADPLASALGWDATLATQNYHVLVAGDSARLLAQ